MLLTRVGFAARGLLYLIVGYLALRMGRSEDASGALNWLQGRTGGLVLGVLALGFLAYGLWRVLDAVFDTQRKGREMKGIAGRLGGGLSGLVHLGLAFTAVKLALGGTGDSGGAERGAAAAMDMPGGAAAFIAVAAVLAFMGAAQLVIAARRLFLKHLSGEARGRWWVVAAGCAGFAARGIIFLAAALLAFRAGREQDAAQAGTLGDALMSLDGSLRLVVAAGLALFGAYSLIEARYRIIPDPDLKNRLRDAAA
jgi:hypothetical protein